MPLFLDLSLSDLVEMLKALSLLFKPFRSFICYGRSRLPLLCFLFGLGIVRGGCSLRQPVMLF